MALTGHYPFDKNANDLSGNSNNLTENGSPTYVTGVKDHAQVLNGTSMYDTAASNAVHNITTGDFSITGWIYRTSDSGVFEAITRKHSFSPNAGYYLAITAADKLEAYIQDSAGTAVTITGATSLATATWYFCAVTFDRDGNGVVYVNAASDASASIAGAAGSLTNTQTLTVGRASGASEAFLTGRIDDLRIYNHALTAAEVTDLYNKAMILIGKNNSTTVLTINSFENLAVDVLSMLETITDTNGDEEDLLIINNISPQMHIEFDWIMTTESSSVTAGTGSGVTTAVGQLQYLIDTLLSKGTDMINDDYVLTIYYGAGVSIVRTGAILKISCITSSAQPLTYQARIDFQIGNVPA